MDLKSFGTALANIGLPLLGAAIPLPGGAALGTMLAHMITGDAAAAPEDILKNLSSSADMLNKAKEMEYQHQETILKIQVDAEQARIAAEQAQVAAVNSTLQADARGDSWLQKNHHAIECLASVGAVIAIYFVLPILGLPVPSVPEMAWTMLGAFTGVTAWQHGVVNKQIAVNQGDSAAAVATK